MTVETETETNVDEGRESRDRCRVQRDTEKEKD